MQKTPPRGQHPAKCWLRRHAHLPQTRHVASAKPWSPPRWTRSMFPPTISPAKTSLIRLATSVRKEGQQRPTLPTDHGWVSLTTASTAGTASTARGNRGGRSNHSVPCAPYKPHPEEWNSGSNQLPRLEAAPRSPRYTIRRWPPRRPTARTVRPEDVTATTSRTTCHYPREPITGQITRRNLRTQARPTLGQPQVQRKPAP